MYKISANTLFMGQKLVFVPECHSTNTLAADLAQKTNVPEGTVVITHHQTAGRGQRGNSWEAERGMNLTFSVVLHPSFLEAANQFVLNQVVSLGLADALHQLQVPGIKIKWPNDIMVDDRKVCGILIENMLSQNKISQSVVGIGLNVNQKEFSLSTPISLALALNKELDPNAVLNVVMTTLEARYLQLRSGKHEPLRHHYHQWLYWKDEVRTFLSNGELIEGKINGVDELGRLQVELKNGIKEFNLKEIQFVR